MLQSDGKSVVLFCFVFKNLPSIDQYYYPTFLYRPAGTPHTEWTRCPPWVMKGVKHDESIELLLLFFGECCRLNFLNVYPPIFIVLPTRLLSILIVRQHPWRWSVLSRSPTYARHQPSPSLFLCFVAVWGVVCVCGAMFFRVLPCASVCFCVLFHQGGEF